MIIQLIPPDIPRFWEAIKFACKKVDEVDEKHMPSYMNEMLVALLNGDAQCFARISDDRKELQALVVTKVLHNAQFDEKYLYVQCLYSWEIVEDDVWQRDIDFIKGYAKREGCKYIGAMSRNKRAQDIMQMIGFKEYTRVYALRLGE